jgi:tetratricopeptide (TPR) repeat protein
MEKQIRNYLKILETSPDNVPAFEALVKLYQDHERWGELANLFVEKSQRTNQADQIPDLLFTAADIYAERLGNFDRVEECHQLVLEREPLNGRALGALRTRFRDSHQWDKLIHLLEREADHLPELSGKADRYTEIAGLWEQELGDKTRKIDYLTKAQAVDPTHLASLRQLKTHYLKNFQVEEALVLVEREEGLLPDDDARAQLYLEVGMLLAEDPFEKDRAIDYLERAQSLSKNKDAKEKVKELKSLDKKWEDLTRRYSDEAISVSDKHDASAIYLKIAGIYYIYAPEREDDILSTIEKSLILDSSNRRALLLGERFLADKGDWQRLVGFLVDVYERARDENLKTEAMAKTARLYDERLDRADEALELYRQVVALRPDHSEAFQYVRADLARNERFDDLRELLSDRLARCHELPAKVETHIELARLASNQDGDIHRAIGHLEDVLDLAPGNVDASRELMELYEQTAQYERLLTIAPVVLAAAKTPAERVERELAVAALLRDRLNRSNDAYDHVAAAFLADPANPECVALLDELTLELECWEKLVGLLKRALSEGERSANWRSLKYKLAQVYDKELSQYDKAETQYQELLEDGIDLETLDALARLYQKDLRWENLVDVLGKKASVTEDIEERRDVLLEKARILEEELVDADRAIVAYNDVVAVMPDELEALSRLEELHEGGGNFAELAEVLVSELAVIVSMPEKVKLNFKLGNVYRDKLGDKENAARAYLAVLELDSAHLPAIGSLEDLLNDGVLPDAIFRGLENYYRSLERWDKLSDGYEALLKSEDDPLSRGALCHKLADVYLNKRQMGEEAFVWVTEGLKTPYNSTEFLDLSLAAARKVGKQTELLELLEAKADQVEDLTRSVELELSLGGLYWDGMQDAEQAEKHFLKAAELAPDDPHALSAAAGFFEQTGRWEDFTDYGQLLAEATPDADLRFQTLGRIAQAFETQLGDLEQAIAVTERIRDLAPDDLAVLDDLARLQRGAERFADVETTLRTKLQKLEDHAARTVVTYELAELLETKLENMEESALLYGQVLVDEPGHDGAFAAMERFLEAGHAERQVARVLQPVYEAYGEHQKLVRVLTVQFNHAEAEEAYPLALRIASLFEEQLNDHSNAFHWYGKAFLAAPGVPLMKELKLAAAEADAWLGLLELGDEKLEQDLAAAERIALLFELAEVEGDTLGDATAARARFEAVLDIDDANERAVDALIALARGREDFAVLADLLESKRLIAEEKNVRRESSLELADIRFAKLNQPDEALALLNELMEERENDPQVFEAMELIYQDEERFEDLKELLERRLKFLREDDDIVPIKIQIGSILENRLERAAEAMEIYLELVSNFWHYPAVGALVDRLLAQESTQLTIANEMEQKYIKTQDWPRLVQVHEIQLKYADDADEKSKLLSKLSGIYQDKLQDPEKAFQGFARVFIDDPKNESALEELEKLSGELGAWKELAEVYVRAGEASAESEEATDLFVKAARLYEDILAFQEESIRAYRKVLDRDRNNMTAIQALEGLCRKTERWDELRDIYLQRIELTDDTAEKKELYVNICILYEHQLDEPLGAAPFYEAILELTPHDDEVVDKLLGLYDEQEAWEKKAGMLAHKLSLVDDRDLRNSLMLEKAALHEEKLDDRESAKDLFKSVLDADESNQQALAKLETYIEDETFQNELARFLEPYYLVWENWDKLIDAKEYQFAHSEDSDERLQLLKDIAETYEQKLENQNLAYAVYTRAFRERAVDGFVQEQLERLAAPLGQFENLSRLYAEEIDRRSPEEDAEAMVALLLNRARIRETYLHEMDEAAGLYRRVLELHDNHPEALNNLERIYSLSKQWDELIDTLERKLTITDGLEPQKSILFQICNINEEELGDNPQAIEVYHRIQELDPADGDVLHALVRLTTAEERWPELIEVRRRQLELADADERRWSLRYEIGLVQWQSLKDFDAAIETFAGVLLEEHHHEACREAMETLMRQADTELAAARILEPLYAEDERHNDLIHTLFIQTRHETDATLRRDLFLRMAELAELRLVDAERGFSFTVSAFENDPFNEAIRQQAERLAGETSRWTDLAHAYSKRVEAIEEVESQVDLFLNAGRIMLRHVEDLDTAEEYFTAVREREGDNAVALDNLEEIFERTEQWPKLVDIYFTKADLTEDDETRIRLFTLAAQVRETRMDDRTGAVNSYLKALDVDGSHLPTLIELDRLYGELERWKELRDVLLRREELAADTSERLGLTFRRGQVVEDRIGDAASALLIYRSILDADDEYEDALRSLEAMVTVPALQLDALGILTPLYEAKNWWERLSGILEVQLDTLVAVPERVAVLVRIKEIYEHRLSDAGRAFQVACRVFTEDYRDQNARQDMERLSVVTGGFEGLVSTYRSFFEQIEETDLKIEIQTKIGRIYEEQLENDEQAVEAYRTVLGIDERNFTAILALDRLYERLGRFSDLVELIPMEFELLDDPKDVRDLRLRLGRLWEEKLADNLTAIDVYSQVLQESPDHPTALAALERLYEKESMWEDLIEIYKAEVRIARGDTKKARLFDAMAQVLFEKLGQAREAIPLWSRVLQFDEQNDAVREKLENLYAHEQMWDELIGHYKKRLRGARGAAERAVVTKRMALVYYERLGQTDQATQLFLKVLEYTPEDLEVIDTLEAIYLKNHSWRELVDLLTRLLDQVSGDDRRSLYLRLTGIQVEQIQDQDKGAEFARRVLDMGPTLQELRRLERLFASSKRYELYMDILTHQEALLEEGDDLVALNFRMAELYTARLNDLSAARACLEKVLELAPGNLQAAEALEPIYRDAAEWHRLIDVLKIRLDEAGRDDEAMALNRQIAETYELRLNDLVNAQDYLSPVLAADPGDADLLAHLETLAQATGRWLELAHLIRDVLPEVENDTRLYRILLFKVAQIYEMHAINRELAGEYYKIYLETGEYNEHAVNFLVAMYEENKEWADLVNTYQLKLPHMTQEEKVTVGCRVAYIFYNYMDQTERAIKTYMQVLAMDDACEEAIDALIDIYELIDDYAELVDVLRRKLHVVSDTNAINAIRLRIADIYRERLSDRRQAKTFYRAIIADDPRHQKALDALEELYLAEENYDELLEVLSRRVNVAETDDQKIGIYRKMADIWETKFDQLDMAVSYLEKTLAIQPGNMESISILERIYREAQDWPNLAATYQRHIDQTIDADEIVQLYTQMGRIHGEYLFQPSKAIEYFGKALKIDERNRDVLSALAELYVANENWTDAIETLERMAEYALDRSAKVDALARLGRIYLENLNEREKAKSVFDRMYDEDPTFVPAIRALRQYYATTGGWEKFLKMVAQEKQYVQDAHERADVLYEEGRYYHQQEQDVDRALGLYREALSLVDDVPEILKVVGHICFERQEWEQARRVLGRLLELDDQSDAQEMARTHYQLAFIAEQEQDDSEALKHYTASYKIDSNSLKTLEGLARTLYKRGDWDRAFRVYQTILVRFRDQKSVPELVDLFSRLGEVNGELGKHDVAVRMYEKALELDPNSVRALSAIVFFFERLENWKKALSYRYRLIKILDGDALFDQWRAVGDIYSEKMGDKDKGLEAYRYALEIRANDVDLLGKVADLLLAAGDYEEAIGVLRGAVAIESDPGRLVNLNMKLGELMRTQGKDPDECLDYYNAALDVMPYRTDIFVTIENYLTERENWELLDNNYRLMIARLPKEDMTRRQEMWKKLGNLLSDKAGNLEDAIKAWEVVAQFDPDDLSVQEHIADLYARSPKYREQAIAMHRVLLDREPRRVNSYRALWKICLEQEEFDKAFCFSGVVDHLGETGTPAAAFYRENLHTVKTDALNSLDRQTWGTLLLQRDARHNIGQILNILFHHVADLLPDDLKQEGLKKKDRLDVSESLTFVNTANFVLKGLGTPLPEIYLKSGWGPGIQVLKRQPSSIMIGADAFQNFPQRELVFLVARAGVLARPDFLVPMVLPTQDVRNLLDASAMIVNPKFAASGNPEVLKTLKKKLEKGLPRKVRDTFQVFVSEYMSMAKDLDIEAWKNGLLLSAHRAGMLMCNDLPTAVKTLKAHPAGLSAQQIKQVEDDLIRFSVSDSYFHLRNFLGFSII